MSDVPSNTTRNKCLIETLILSLDDDKNSIVAFNIFANVLLMVTTILGNASILISFVMVSSIRSASNNLLFGLALTDLGVGLVVHPLYIFVLLSIHNDITPHCNVLAAYSIAASLLGGISLLYIITIGIDRYLAMRLHLRYRELVTEKRTNIAQMAVWLINCLLSLVWLEGFRIYSEFAAVTVVILLCTAFCVYMKIYRVVKRHRTQIHFQIESQMLHLEICRFTRVRKSAINTLYVFFVFLICYLPFSTSIAINSMYKTPPNAGIMAFELSATLMLSNSSLNPLMYCLRFREFRIAIKKTYSRVFFIVFRSE